MRILVAIPLIVILIAFALSNQQVVQLGLWPTDILVDMPLSVAVLVAAGLFFVVGGFMTWTTALAARARARHAERTVRQLEAQVEAMRARPPAMVQGGGQGRAPSLTMLPPA